jgi:hypothetical protein
VTATAFDHQPFLDSVLAHWGDPGPVLVWADLFDDLGETDTALALRWCAAHSYWPRLFTHSTTLRSAFWYDDGVMAESREKGEQRDTNDLPTRLFVMLKKGKLESSCRPYESLTEAFADLGQALRSLGEKA